MHFNDKNAARLHREKYESNHLSLPNQSCLFSPSLITYAETCWREAAVGENIRPGCVVHHNLTLSVAHSDKFCMIVHLYGFEQSVCRQICNNETAKGSLGFTLLK